MQDCPAASGPVQQRSTPSQAYQQPYQPQMVHPDLYRLIKMFPDFSTKTLHRIFGETSQTNNNKTVSTPSKEIR